MAAMRSLCGPLELAIAYDGRLELFVDVLYNVTVITCIRYIIITDKNEKKIQVLKQHYDKMTMRE